MIKITTITITTMTIIIFILSITLTQTKVNVYEEVKLGGVKGTGSMEPMIYDDAKYLYQEFNGIPKCGHLYVYAKTNKSVLHRFIYEMNDGQLIFKGDNNAVSDKPISVNEITKEVVGVRWDI